MFSNYVTVGKLFSNALSLSSYKGSNERRKQIAPNILYSWEFTIQNRHSTVAVSSNWNYFLHMMHMSISIHTFIRKPKNLCALNTV